MAAEKVSTWLTSILLASLPGMLVCAAGWGALSNRVENVERRMDQVEQLPKEISELRADVRVLLERTDPKRGKP